MTKQATNKGDKTMTNYKYSINTNIVRGSEKDCQQFIHHIKSILDDSKVKFEMIWDTYCEQMVVSVVASFENVDDYNVVRGAIRGFANGYVLCGWNRAIRDGRPNKAMHLI